MSIEVKVPALPESVADATVAKWYKELGDTVIYGENLVDLETDKVMLEVPAPSDGVLQQIIKPEGERVKSSELLAMISSEVVKTASAEPAKAPSSAPATASAAVDTSELSPSVRRMIGEHDLDITKISGTGKGGRITSEDVNQYLASINTAAKNKAAAVAAPTMPAMQMSGERPEQRVPMTRLRARIAERLLQAQHNAALLTTFNEVNLQAVNDLRARYKDDFEKKHGVRLGFMSFFVKASVEALKRFAAVNASIDCDDIVYHGYFDIGVAVSTERGLVVPVLRNADQMSMADIEKTIGEYAKRARDGKLTLEEMTGGTFTITNGGVFGSLLATPIINPPQSAILGMHKIQQRPVVENNQIVIRPMMYLALSYDHRMIDGRESVQFLVTIKELLEDPSRLLLEV